MKMREIKQLHNGDEVTWNDPDGGKRVIKILNISVSGEVVSISGTHVPGGGYTEIECFARELS